MASAMSVGDSIALDRPLRSVLSFGGVAMKRFIITVLVATVLHAVACIIAPPYEFGHNRIECFFFAFVSGLLGFPVMFAVVLLPLRWGLRRFMPRRMRRAQAIAAGLVLLGLSTAWVFTHPTLPFQHGFYFHWWFWSTVAIAVTVSFFWPFGTQITPPNEIAGTTDDLGAEFADKSRIVLSLRPDGARLHR